MHLITVFMGEDYVMIICMHVHISIFHMDILHEFIVKSDLVQYK